MPNTRLSPKIVDVIREGYTSKLFFSDLSAGVIVGIVALPLSIAFAIASGVKPEQGLYTAIIAGFTISLLSGSRFQIGGPTGAFIVIIYGIIQRYGYDGLAVSTLLAGVFLIIMGVSRLGSMIKYIPYPVTVGFTSGIAIIIAAGQLQELLGLKFASQPSNFIDRIIAYACHIGSVNLWSVGIGCLTIAVILLWTKITRLIPGSIVAIILTTAIVKIFHLPVETIGTRFGDISCSLPRPSIPKFDLNLIPQLISPAVSIALLAGIESLLSAVVADGMTGRRHRSNMELVGLGVANIASVVFAGIPATGAIARTATNIKNGGKTPFAGIIHAATLLIIMLFFGRFAGWIPMASLAGILMIVAYNMSEWHMFVKLLRSPGSDILVLITTFLLTVFIDLTVAIQVGVVLASILFMRRMSNVTEFGYVTRILNNEEEEASDPNNVRGKIVPEGVEVFEVNGPFFFGAADKFKHTVSQIGKSPKILIIRLREVLTLDATGLRALEDVYDKSRREGTVLILSGVHAQPLFVMQRAGFLDRVGERYFFRSIDDALDLARQILETSDDM